MIKNKKAAVIIMIIIVIILVILVVPGGNKEKENNDQQSSYESKQTMQQSETYDEGLNEWQIEEMERENENKGFYVWSDNGGSWEEIGLMGNTDYTYVTNYNGEQTENCSGHYKKTGDTSIILAYEGEAYEGRLENDVLYIFGKEYVKMEDSHM